jgi:hypothetical protein
MTNPTHCHLPRGSVENEWKAANPETLRVLKRKWEEAVEARDAGKKQIVKLARSIGLDHPYLAAGCSDWSYRENGYTEAEIVAKQIPDPEDRLRYIKAVGKMRAANDRRTEYESALFVVGCLPEDVD